MSSLDYHRQLYVYVDVNLANDKHNTPTNASNSLWYTNIRSRNVSLCIRFCCAYSTYANAHWPGKPPNRPVDSPSFRSLSHRQSVTPTLSTQYYTTATLLPNPTPPAGYSCVWMCAYAHAPFAYGIDGCLFLTLFTLQRHVDSSKRSHHATHNAPHLTQWLISVEYDMVYRAK